MSFFRHTETHQTILNVKGRDQVSHALTHPSDESPVGYSWRVALQQSSLPLHQPAPTLQQSRGPGNRNRCPIATPPYLVVSLLGALQYEPSTICVGGSRTLHTPSQLVGLATMK
jgi:hypothetical protein